MARSKYWMFLLTEEEHETILKHQNNLCAICKSPTAGTLNIDHDHKSGLVRGGLCYRCNMFLGSLTIEFLNKALEYLKNPPATVALGAPHIGLPGRVNTKKQRQLYNKLQKQAQNEKSQPSLFNDSDIPDGVLQD